MTNDIAPADAERDIDLLVAPTDHTVLVENDRTGECQEATADDRGILRNGRGQSFSAGAYSIVAEQEMSDR